jgi:hypothetical protein
MAIPFAAVSVARCASIVLAESVNAGVWFPPLGSVGMAVYIKSLVKMLGVLSMSTNSTSGGWKAPLMRGQDFTREKPMLEGQEEFTVGHIALEYHETQYDSVSYFGRAGSAFHSTKS